MIVTAGQPRTHGTFVVQPPPSAQGLPQGLEGLEASAAAGGMDPQAPCCAVIDDEEDRGVALPGQVAGRVRRPQHVRPLRDDAPVVRFQAVSALPARLGASRSASRMSRSTRAFEVPVFFRQRSRAQTFR